MNGKDRAQFSIWQSHDHRSGLSAAWIAAEDPKVLTGGNQEVLDLLVV